MALRNLLSDMKDLVTVNENVPLELEVAKMLAERPTTPSCSNDLGGYRAAGNIWSTRERTCWAMNIKLEELIKKILGSISEPKEPRLVSKVPFLDDVRTEFDPEGDAHT